MRVRERRPPYSSCIFKHAESLLVFIRSLPMSHARAQAMRMHSSSRVGESCRRSVEALALRRSTRTTSWRSGDLSTLRPMRWSGRSPPRC